MRPDEPIPLPSNKQCQAWAYVGSANLSESAWYVFPSKPTPPGRTNTATLLTNHHHQNRGRLVQDRTTKEPKLNCRNWECGVLIPVISSESMPAPAESSKTTAQEDKPLPGSQPPPQESATGLDIFRKVVPVPMRFPGARYGPDRGPWYYMDADST